MTLHAKKDGNWSKVKGLHIRQGGVWTAVKKAYIKENGVWKPYYTSEIVVEISGTHNTLTLKDMFSASDWQSDTSKRVVLLPDAVVNGVGWGAIAAQPSGASAGAATWGGNLILENRGAIQGAGGAPNGGVGGPALHDNSGVGFGKQITVLNYGIIRSGGGGGGKGGNGTGTTDTGEQFSQYPITTEWAYDTNYSPPLLGITVNNDNYVRVRQSINPTSYVSGNNTFYRGAFKYNSDTIALYGVRMVSTVATTGGDGGRGQGSDAANTAGSVGGANAGKGGDGGFFGNAGSAGANGNAGNGNAGGYAGIAYTAALWAVENIGGSVLGRVN